ncbi:hypothetical protein N0V83_008261 [Neocucurbitaria cava]|uniref:C-CAP/cofactor C-like domain-containing protein n=1 Tax=Neocucurbitaria cava TaxID=798079 RepID=A0A9W8Y4S0_9PLEO|nr:hypothetical protein N0V83_008261 [Neocucurbitaria cava]
MATSPASTETGLKERFFRYFQHEVTALQEQMERLNQMSISGGERTDAVDHCLAGINRLSHEVKDASNYIPAYDQRTYSEAIKALSEKLQNTRNAFNPPKKFQFKSRKTVASAISVNNAPVPTSDTANTNSSSAPTPLANPPPKEEKQQQQQQQEAPADNVEEDGIDGIKADNMGIRRPSFSHATKITISNHSSLHIIVPPSASHATSSGTLSHLRGCVVDLSAATTTEAPSAAFAALYLKHIKDSLIICGQIAGAIHITDVSNSIIVTSCRQFRMHDSKNVEVYLHSASRPIFEDCEGLRFAPLPDVYMTAETRQAANQWDQIDDFKWLKAEPSPHFTLLPEAQRVQGEVWTEKVGSGRTSLDDTLKAVRVQ